VIERLVVTAVLIAAFALPLHADFAAVARAIDSQSGVDRVWIPFLGVARAVVRVVQPKGVRDVQLVTFTTAHDLDPQKLQDIMQEKAGPGFKPLVRVWSRKTGEWSFIYAKPSREKNRIELMVLAQDDEETVLVRVDVDAEVVARELEAKPRNMQHMARR
jgi:hypothetical protein